LSSVFFEKEKKHEISTKAYFVFYKIS